MGMTSDSKKNLLVKGTFIALTALCLQIPVILIRSVIDAREDLSSRTGNEITASWGGSQTVCPPKLVLSHEEKTTDKDGKEIVCRSDVRYVPAETVINGDVSVEVLRKSIYEVPVYRAELDIRGSFMLSDEHLKDTDGKGGRLFLDIYDRKGLEEAAIKINGQKTMLTASPDGLYAPVPENLLQSGSPLEYEIRVTTKGSGSLEFMTEAGRLEAVLKSDFPDPGFVGNSLPARRTVSPDGFKAGWKFTELNGADKNTFGVKFVVPVSQYRQTTRSVKYSFLVILLVFMAVYLAESITRRNVSIIQYIVTGLSLCLFYLILLSLTEYMAFAYAYLAASVLTVASLGWYFYAILKSKVSFAFTGLVAVLYAFIYMLMQLETASLLVGTAALFLLICAVMYFTRNAGESGEYPI